MYCFTILIFGYAPLCVHAGAAATEPGGGDRGTSQTWDSRYAEIRVGTHPDHVRIVFSTAEENVQKAAVTLLTTQAVRDTVRIEFPRSLILVLQDRRGVPPETPVEIQKGVKIISSGSTCRIVIDNLAHVSVSRLASPPRLALNAYIALPPGAQVPRQETPQTQPAPAHEARALTYVIDAGHGGYDKGMVARDVSEKDVTLALSRDLMQTLTRKGKSVVMTRTGDQGLSIRERARTAGSKSPSITLSVHVSSSRESSVYTAPPPGQSVLRALIPPGSRDENRDMSGRYAEALSQHLSGVFGMPPRRGEMPIPLLLAARGAAVVLEVPHPDHFKYDARARDKIVQAIANALLSVTPAPSRSDVPALQQPAAPRDLSGRTH